MNTTSTYCKSENLHIKTIGKYNQPLISDHLKQQRRCPWINPQRRAPPATVVLITSSRTETRNGVCLVDNAQG